MVFDDNLKLNIDYFSEKYMIHVQHVKWYLTIVLVGKTFKQACGYMQSDGWMDGLRFYVLFNSGSVISG